MLSTKKKIHFIGIGGIGMSGIARILLELGHEVTGSDVKLSSVTKGIEALGGRVFPGHNAANLGAADIAVYSSAIAGDNPERMAAAARGIPVLLRAAMLAELMKGKKVIAVTGSHGKTTTTGMIASVLLQANLDPTVVVGAEVKRFGGGTSKLGRGDYFVAEADESDSSFLLYSPLYAVITNIDRDHMDHYHNLEEIIDAFSEFANKTKREGEVFLFYDDENIKKILCRIDRRVTEFGLSKKTVEKNNRSPFLYADAIKAEGRGLQFDCIYQGRCLGKISLSLPGEHNIVNALPAIAIGIKLGITFPVIQEALASYSGLGRRFEIKGEINNITVIDDYAHHPREIEAALKSLRAWQRRVVCVFQPHRYTRTEHLKDDFGPCFLAADEVIITHIYSAGEKPIPGVSAKDIYERALKSGHKHAIFLARPEILGHLLNTIKAGDVVMLMGAGDITELAAELVEELKKR